jgi:hypothetical protein
MNEPVLDELDMNDHGDARRHHGAEETLVLRQVAADSVIDRGDGQQPLQLLSFGAMRETCPSCAGAKLRLVLRQTNVRAAHLSCPACNACFDAHFTDGRSAFAI